MNLLPTKIIKHLPEQLPQLAVIWLHGLGADYNDFISVIGELNLSIPTQFVFPNAPLRAITINAGMVMRGWYDIFNFDLLEHKVDTQGIMQSVSQIEQLINQLISEGFNSQQIIIAGFSQGGVISYYTGLSSKYDLGGVIILSAYLPDEKLIKAELVKPNLAMLISHGTFDPLIPVVAAYNARQIIEKLGLTPEFHVYPMAHSLCSQQINDIKLWIERNFSASPFA